MVLQLGDAGVVADAVRVVRKKGRRIKNELNAPKKGRDVWCGVGVVRVGIHVCVCCVTHRARFQRAMKCQEASRAALPPSAAAAVWCGRRGTQELWVDD